MKRIILLPGLLLLLFVLLAACSKKVQGPDTGTRARALFAALPEVMPGSENDTPELKLLGEKLYFEKNLSINRTQACNSCHQVDNNGSGTDNSPTSVGALGKLGGRNSPTVLNAGLHFSQFWDGRAPDLAEQAKGPILNPIEMGLPDEATAVRRIKEVKEYPDLFAKAFPNQKEPITYDNIAGAIAAFERTLITRDRFDDYLKGDETALTDEEKQGLALFMDKGCPTCHSGSLLGGRMYQKFGLLNPYPDTTDLGRFVVTHNAGDKMIFKVPSLRNVAITGPYFHNGKTPVLDDAVKTMGKLQLNQELTQDETNLILSFLNSMTGKGRVESKHEEI